MGLAVYIVASVVFSIVFMPALRKFVGPEMVGVRLMLSGGLFVAILLIIGWAGSGVLFFTGHSAPDWKVAIVFGFAWGFGLAIAWHNIAKAWSGGRS